jgi:hypothetical protein
MRKTTLGVMFVRGSREAKRGVLFHDLESYGDKREKERERKGVIVQCKWCEREMKDTDVVVLSSFPF